VNAWLWVLTIGGTVLVWLIFSRLFIAPGEREFAERTRTCLDKQAQKRNGKVKVTQGRPTLTVPYKTANIELSLISNNVELYSEYTYARFRTEAFTDKKFMILLNSKDFFLKPLAIGTRVEGFDDEFSAKYIVTGNDASFVKSVLAKDVRDKLLQESLHVKFGRRTDSSQLSRERGWLTVFTQGMKADDEVFDGLIETAILFYERLEALNRHSD
jgi:hypothetical protein